MFIYTKRTKQTLYNSVLAVCVIAYSGREMSNISVSQSRRVCVVHGPETLVQWADQIPNVKGRVRHMETFNTYIYMRIPGINTFLPTAKP